MDPQKNTLPDFLNNAKQINVLDVVDISEFINKIKNKRKNTCPICLNFCVAPSKINNCTHIYCNRCISKWSKMSSKCPLCRARFDKIIIIK